MSASEVAVGIVITMLSLSGLILLPRVWGGYFSRPAPRFRGQDRTQGELTYIWWPFGDATQRGVIRGFVPLTFAAWGIVFGYWAVLAPGRRGHLSPATKALAWFAVSWFVVCCVFLLTVMFSTGRSSSCVRRSAVSRAQSPSGERPGVVSGTDLPTDGTARRTGHPQTARGIEAAIAPMMVRRANAHYFVEVDANDDRERIARDLWTHIRSLNTQNIRQYPAAARAIDGGADPSDVVRAMAAASYEATFNALFVLTAEEDIAALAGSGAAIALHEDLLSADPTGQEGQDLFR